MLILRGDRKMNLRWMIDRSSFEVYADPSIDLSSIDDPSDHLSDPSDWTSWAGYKYPCSVCVRQTLRQIHTETFERA
ncbi:hypothetical protein HanXRQr2_Chr12g0537681 [Helianthus annuus]|uniref:Uncharacterized protein n=1 Tax=Helianthus annuus TaxID=4232 RepID=A0A9K3MVT5_HELAN|nr:hypothetical protein HanXRQr2_Chr12g0537681 [Helianthus annuus]